MAWFVGIDGTCYSRLVGKFRDATFYFLVGKCFAKIALSHNQYLIVNEKGEEEGEPANETATQILQSETDSDKIVYGIAIVCFDDEMT